MPLSAVQHRTQAALRSARYETGGLGTVWRPKKKIPPLGLTVTKRKKDIVTDSFVEETVWGRAYGEDKGYDFLALLCCIGGGAIIREVYYNPMDEGDMTRAVMLGLGLITSLSGWGHLIPGTVNLG